MDLIMAKEIRNPGDLVTSLDQIRDKDNTTKVEHSFLVNQKLVIDRICRVDSRDSTKNYWCVDENGTEQLMNEKEITDYIIY